MDEEQVGDVAQPSHGVVVEVRDRLVGHVRARHDQRLADVGEQDVVQRRVGEHHAEVGRARGDGGGDRRPGAARGEDDRPRASGQHRLVGCAQLNELTRGRDRRHHQRKRLVLAMLARPQPRHRLLVGGPAGQVVSADPLDRNDRPAAQCRDRRTQRIGAWHPGAWHLGATRCAAGHPGAWHLGATRCAAGVEQGQAGPQTGQALGWAWKRRSSGVVVLGLAGRAHRERGHRGQRAVVGDAADDRESRPAVRAVDERVAMAAVAGVEQLGQAVVARRRVGRDERARRVRRARCRRSRSRRRRSARRAVHRRAPRWPAAAPAPSVARSARRPTTASPRPPAARHARR